MSPAPDAQGSDVSAPSWVLALREIEVSEEVGDGVTSVVFRGACRGEEVAVKSFTADTEAMSPKGRVNLERELAILMSVKHPNLVRFIGVATDGAVKLVTEFCRGGSAFDMLHNSGLTFLWTQKLKMLADVASAMEYLHGHTPPIIHRDLKSLNLLLQSEVLKADDVPVVKVTDFGLSRMLKTSAAAETLTRNAGTGHWMAPEVFATNSYGAKADVYSFSMITFEVICQEIPFGDVHPAKVGLCALRGKRPDLQLLPDDCPPDLVCLMASSWGATPESRPDFKSICRRLGRLPQDW